MTNVATEKEIIHSIRNQLPQLLHEDPSLRDHILTIFHERFPTRVETEDRFTRMLNELRRDRKEQTRKWEEQARKWEDQTRRWEEQKREDDRKWAEQARKWEEQKREDDRKWAEQARKWEEQKREDDRKWEEQARKWEEQKREDNRKWEEQKQEDRKRWEESNRRFDETHKEIMAQAVKHERSIGALGSRWGLQSERAFRDALAAILEGSFGVQVINVNEFDDKGEVFGRPDQVEIDVIIKNGLMIICELKSSVSKSDMYLFERKARFYEKRRGRKANRLMVISPMIDDRAREVGEKLGIEMYFDSMYVPVEP